LDKITRCVNHPGGVGCGRRIAMQELPLHDEDDAAPPLPATSISYRPIKFDKTIRIAVTGDVRVTRTERRIIDTPAFQRLRGIKQLGPSVWVYPTAVHTRFDHSLGVLEMVDQMVQEIREVKFQVSTQSESEVAVDITDDQRLLARLYALLHDVTHVPFGHTLEDELGIFPSHDAFQKSEKHGGQDRFEKLVGPSSEIGKIIVQEHGAAFYERLRKIILNGGKGRLEYQEQDKVVYDEIVYFLISDTVCADLLDYVRRDNYFASTEMTLSFRFLKFMYVADVVVDGEKKRRLVIRLWKPKTGRARRDTMTDLAALMEARYMIAERIYFHPTKIIVGTMLGRAVLEANLAGCLTNEMMLDLSDDALLYVLRTLDGPKEKSRKPPKGNLGIAKSLAQAVADRRLYKCHRRYGENEFRRGGDNVNLKNDALRALKDPETRRQIENEVCEWAGVSAGDVLIYPAPSKMNSKVADVQVDWQGGHMRLAEITDPILASRLKTIREAHEQLWGIDLIVSDALSKDQRQAAQFAFEAKFLGKDRANECYASLVRDFIDAEARYSNYPAESKKVAARAVAEKLVENQVAFHEKSLKEMVIALTSEVISKA
jgi:HD superfamily phosphohydrolase